MDSRRPFHLAFAVDDLGRAREFYGGVLGCPEGRSSERWVDFDLFGHQIVAHLSEPAAVVARNPVDGHDVPVPHFGVVLHWEEFEGFAERLRAAGVHFEIEPTLRFAGAAGEQRHQAGGWDADPPRGLLSGDPPGSDQPW